MAGRPYALVGIRLRPCKGYKEKQSLSSLHDPAVYHHPIRSRSDSSRSKVAKEGMNPLFEASVGHPRVETPTVVLSCQKGTHTFAYLVLVVSISNNHAVDNDGSGVCKIPGPRAQVVCPCHLTVDDTELTCIRQGRGPSLIAHHLNVGIRTSH